MVHFLSFENTVDFYKSVMGLWLKIREDLRIPFFDSRYEMIVLEKSKSINALSSFLKVERNIDREGVCEKQVKRYISTPSYQDAMQPVFKRSMNRWMNYREILGDKLKELDPIAIELKYAPMLEE